MRQDEIKVNMMRLSVQYPLNEEDEREEDQNNYQIGAQIFQDKGRTVLVPIVELNLLDKSKTSPRTDQTRPQS